MEKILESIWMVFVLIAGWFGARLTKQIDDLSKDKADATQTREEHLSQGKLIHELDRRVDESQHTNIGRAEYKSDITALHSRINVISEKKADKIMNVRTHQSKEKNGES
tara:strand:+ start:276 stop:602 length:327 start_codon:yes stop_codon:yes gene_type:complete